MVFENLKHLITAFSGHNCVNKVQKRRRRKKDPRRLRPTDPARSGSGGGKAFEQMPVSRLWVFKKLLGGHVILSVWVNYNDLTVRPHYDRALGTTAFIGKSSPLIDFDS